MVVFKTQILEKMHFKNMFCAAEGNIQKLSQTFLNIASWVEVNLSLELQMISMNSK